MTIGAVREICRTFPGVTEDVKWGADLCFCVGGKMFAAMDLNPPHGIGFKCTADDFGQLVERPGIIPAPYLARAMWVQEEVLGQSLGRREFERLLKSAYDLVVAKLPQSKRPGAVLKPGRTTPRRRKPLAQHRPPARHRRAQ